MAHESVSAYIFSYCFLTRCTKVLDVHPVLRAHHKISLDDGTTLINDEAKNCTNISIIDGQGPNTDKTGP
jgi:hypothetical protein